ncbi:CUB domain-containing protein 1-like isoform X2 [Brienomyrus brachyistius]|nr:CUB domain-containing protein 1-like isoform X2 [Brienomyrus brachyistius]XP_048881817.1 CUB domain-containing protein 1-like isoform X2 [Brienomyrus brachyistius]
MVKNAKGPACSVCLPNSAKCVESLNNVTSENLNFTCPNPQDVFVVKTATVIDCTAVTCRMDVGKMESSPFLRFNRTFTWEVTVLPGRAIRLGFPSAGLRQVLPSIGCPEQNVYTITARQATRDTAVGTFCPNGTVSGILVLSKGVVTVEVPSQMKMDLPLFSISVGPDIKTLAQFEVAFPSGLTVSEFFSPAYPARFPDGDLMWSFDVPPKHYATVQFVSSDSPECSGERVTVEYKYKNFSVAKNLADAQPAKTQGNFSMYLRNCKDRKFLGIYLAFKVLVTPAETQGSCSVSLAKEAGLSIHIKKTNPKSGCVIKKDSVVVAEVTLSAGKVTNLNFKDCAFQDLSLMINQTIVCRQLWECPSNITLTVPPLQPCLPQLISSVTWHLQTPAGGGLELLPATGSLQQMLPGFNCNGSFTLRVTERDGFSVGHFCPLGPIRRVHTQSNVSITTTPTTDNLLIPSQQSFFTVSFQRKIKENYIFFVSPQEGVPTVLATPGWPEGMRSYSTASWIISLAKGFEASLGFVAVNQPKCEDGHTGITVKTQSSHKELYSQREDEDSVSTVLVPDSFYLNVSNCLVEREHFSMFSKVVMRRTASALPVILGLVGVMLLLAGAVLLAVCWVVRKRRRQDSSLPVSIYNPNGNFIAPGHPQIPKTRADSESHIYAYIDDTMVYTHLFQESDMDGMQVDAYRSFTGPTDSECHSSEVPLYSADVDVFRPLPDGTPPLPSRNVSTVKDKETPLESHSGPSQDAELESESEDTT